MAKGRLSSAFFGLTISAALAACGLYTPDKDPFAGDPLLPPSYIYTRQGNYEKALVDHVTCEISQGLYEAKLHLNTNLFDKNWLNEKWGTTVTLSITVEDQTGLSPGISTITPLPNVVFPFPAGGNVTSPQSFSFNLGGTASVNALRTETIQYTYKNSTLIAYPDCPNPTGILIDGDLKIKDFIYDKVQVIVGGSGFWNPNYPLYNTWTEEITFVSSYGASATPTWHLARLTANASSNLIVGQRTNTNDLVITLGPLDPCQTEENKKQDAKKNPKEPSGEPSKESSDKEPAKEPRQEVLLRQIRDALVKSPVPTPTPKPGCPPGARDAPIQLSAQAMTQHNARVQANAIAVSVTGQTH
jgi:hypothetical protein